MYCQEYLNGQYRAGNDVEYNVWREYDGEKAALMNRALTPREYESEIKSILDRLEKKHGIRL